MIVAGEKRRVRVRGGTKDVTMIVFSKDKGDRIKDELWKRRERDGERKRGHGQRKDVIVNREAEKRCACVRGRESC